MFLPLGFRKCLGWTEDPAESGAAGRVAERLPRSAQSSKACHLHGADPAGVQHGDEGLVSDSIQACFFSDTVVPKFTLSLFGTCHLWYFFLPFSAHQQVASPTAWSPLDWPTSGSWFASWLWQWLAEHTAVLIDSRAWRGRRQRQWPSAITRPAWAFSHQPLAAWCHTALLLTGSWWRSALRSVILTVDPLSQCIAQADWTP